MPFLRYTSRLILLTALTTLTAALLVILLPRLAPLPYNPYFPYLTLPAELDCVHENMCISCVERYCYLTSDAGTIAYTLENNTLRRVSFWRSFRANVGTFYALYGAASRVLNGRYFTLFQWNTPDMLITVYARHDSLWARVTGVTFSLR